MANGIHMDEKTFETLDTDAKLNALFKEVARTNLCLQKLEGKKWWNTAKILIGSGVN